MSILRLGRRQFLTLPLALLFAPLAQAAVGVRKATYAADVGILYDMLSFRLDGTIDEVVDPEARRYAVTVAGRGANIANRIESTGTLRAGRWAPVRTTSWFDVHGRESRSEVTYDYGGRSLAYHARGETFLRRRLRVVDDTMALPGHHVDDPLSAMLNYREGRWPVGADGRFLTHVVRRRRVEGEGPDDVASVYRAEIVPLELKPEVDPQTGKASASFDLTRFSSWARENRPGRIVFGPDRRPEVITTSMIMGTSVTIRLTGA